MERAETRTLVNEGCYIVIFSVAFLLRCHCLGWFGTRRILIGHEILTVSFSNRTSTESPETVPNAVVLLKTHSRRFKTCRYVKLHCISHLSKVNGWLLIDWLLILNTIFLLLEGNRLKMIQLMYRSIVCPALKAMPMSIESLFWVQHYTQ